MINCVYLRVIANGRTTVQLDNDLQNDNRPATNFDRETATRKPTGKI